MKPVVLKDLTSFGVALSELNADARVDTSPDAALAYM
jgi:hypothetical protein